MEIGLARLLVKFMIFVIGASDIWYVVHFFKQKYYWRFGVMTMALIDCIIWLVKVNFV